MASIKSLSQGRKDIYLIKIGDLHVMEGWNARDMSDPANQAHVVSLAESIREELAAGRQGVKEPLTIFMDIPASAEGEEPNTEQLPFIENGHCRRLAIYHGIEQGWEGFSEELTVPCKFGDKDATPAERYASQLTLNSGKNLNPIEQAILFAKLKDECQLSDEEIAKLGKCTRAYVGQLRKLMTANKTILEMVRSGVVAATLAIDVISSSKDMKTATQRLKDAVKAAKALGKGKATKKHVPEIDGPEEGGEGGGEGSGEGGGSAPKAKAKKDKPVDPIVLESFMGAIRSHESGEAEGTIVTVFDREKFDFFAKKIGFTDAALKAAKEDVI